MIDSFFISFIFFLFSLGHLGRISLLNQEINFYAYEVLMTIYLLFLFLKNKFAPLLNFLKKNPLAVSVFSFFLLSFVINIPRYQFRENIIGFLYLLRIIFYSLFFIYFYSYLKKRKLKKVINKGLMIFVFLTIILSLTQYFFYPNLRNIIYLGWDPHWYRMLGFFFDSYLAGAIFGLLVIYFVLKKKPFLSLIFLIFTILTFSRNIYFSLMVTLTIFWLKNRKFKELFIFIFLLIFLIVITPKPFGESVNLKRFFTIEARINDYKQALAIWKKSPILGIGYNHIGAEKINFETLRVDFGYSHAFRGFSSSYLIVLVCGGILGLVFFLLSIRKILFLNQTSYWIGFFLLLASFFDNVFLHPFVIFLYLMIILVNLTG